MSLSMNLLFPVRVVEVLPGDSHRISTSFSLISNPLVKPLLQGVRMRYTRFWVPRRIYHPAQRANNSGFEPNKTPYRWMDIRFSLPLNYSGGSIFDWSHYQASSLGDLFSYAPLSENLTLETQSSTSISSDFTSSMTRHVNAEPYIAYLDIVRNYYADSATKMVCFLSTAKYDVPNSTASIRVNRLYPVVDDLSALDAYIDGIQNSPSPQGSYRAITPYVVGSGLNAENFEPIVIQGMNRPATNIASSYLVPETTLYSNDCNFMAISHLGLCVPVNRPDRLSRLYDVTPLTSQNATISANEVSIGNLAFLSKLQRFLARKFFGDDRFTGVMYSVFGQRVPHVDSPVLLDVFDYEIGSELVASTNSTETQNPGVLGGYFQASGVLTTRNGRKTRKYAFPEPGYIIDLVSISPRLYRDSFLPDFIPLTNPTDTEPAYPQQGNFIPDFNGLGWQQPAFSSAFSLYGVNVSKKSFDYRRTISPFAEPCYQQYRTLPDTSHGLMNPLRAFPLVSDRAVLHSTLFPRPAANINSPLFVFSDRMDTSTSFVYFSNTALSDTALQRQFIANYQFTDPYALQSIFGITSSLVDNIFAVFRYSHRAKRQVTKRFTLSFA